MSPLLCAKRRGGTAGSNLLIQKG
jgi:hypothetical protein